MLNYFQILFHEQQVSTWNVSHIQFNLFLKLKKFRYLKFRNINFIFTRSESVVPDVDFSVVKTPVLYLYHILTSREEEISRDHNSASFIEMVYWGIFNALEEFWEKKGWNKKDLEAMIRTIRQEDYKSVFPLFGPVINISRKYKAIVYIEYFPDFTIIIAEILLSKNKVIKVPVYKCTVDLTIIKRFIHHGFWNTHDAFIIQDELREIEFVINHVAEVASVNTVLSPGANSLQELQGFLKALSFDTEYKERYRLLGFPL